MGAEGPPAATGGMMDLGALTTEDAAGLDRGAVLPVLPVGSCEQHGPHLALATDAAIADAFARRLVDALGARALLCPLLPYGLSEHHESFAGTLTLTPPVFIDAVVDLAASLQRQGFPCLLIVNGHGGNVDALRVASRRTRRELGLRLASVMWLRLAADVCAEEAVGDTWGHACEIETSVALALRPELVYRERVREPAPRPPVDPLLDPTGPLADTATWFSDLTTDGTLGDPRAASRELGERVVAVALERAEGFARRLLESARDQRSSPGDV